MPVCTVDKKTKWFFSHSENYKETLLQGKLLYFIFSPNKANVFYSGCVVVEVRDYRQSQTTSSYDSNYVLLQPTYQVSHKNTQVVVVVVVVTAIIIIIIMHKESFI